jgi:hypothetical protein
MSDKQVIEDRRARFGFEHLPLSQLIERLEKSRDERQRTEERQRG